MDKETVKPPITANAYMLLALLISKGLVSLTNIDVSEIKATAKKTKDEKIADKLKKLVDNKTTPKNERKEIKAVLSNIDTRYPELKDFDNDSQEAKNLTAIAGINAPKMISVPSNTPVTLPQELATNMQNEIFTGRRETTRLAKSNTIQKGKKKRAEESLKDERAIVATRDSLIGELNNNVEALQLELEIKRKEADEYKRNTQQLQE
jgi:hypothetical protein